MAKRDRSAIAELYALNVREAVRLAYLLTGDRQLAEDIAQDAFVRVFGRFGNLRESHAFDRYLRTTIVNLTRSHFRRRRIERVYLDRLRRAPTDHTILPDIEQHEVLWQKLLELPERQRMAVVLHYYEDLPEHQVADILGISDAAVKSLIARAMKTLRENTMEYAS